MQVKIIEKDEARCEFLCETFPKATIIHGDATDHELLLEEGIQEADAMIALTGMDEENIIMSLFAKTQGVEKIMKTAEPRWWREWALTASFPPSPLQRMPS